MRRKTVGYFVVLGVLSAFFLQNHQVHKRPIDLIEPEDRVVLEPLLAELMRYSGFGYTLFGDKPVSIVLFPLDPEVRTSGLFTLYAQSFFPVCQKYRALLLSKKYHLGVGHRGSFFSVSLINKSAFLSVVDKNLDLFRQVLGDDVSSQALLKSICEGMSFEQAVRGNEVLVGILYGYGRNNSQLYNRRRVLGDFLAQTETLPWKNRKGSPDTSSIEEELNAIESKVTSFLPSLQNMSSLPSVFLPGFIADPDDPETIELVEKYKKQRKCIMDVLSREDFLETILTTFIES